MAGIAVEFACDALGDGLTVLGARGVEGMNALSAWTLDVLSTSGPLAMEDALFAGATLALVDPLEEHTRSIGLILTSVTFEEDIKDGLLYRLTLAPAEALLRERSGYRIFLEKTAQEIVQQVLVDAGTAADRIVWRLASQYAMRLHTTQYGETEWAFVERLLAEEGISYWFDMADAGPTVVLGDAMGSHDPIAITPAMPFLDGAIAFPSRRVFKLSLTEETCTESVFVREYDVRHPDVLIEGKSGDGAMHYYEYPAQVLAQTEAEARAVVRREQLARWKVHADGKSDSVRMQPGHALRLGGAADEGANQPYLVVHVEHEYARPGPNVQNARAYQNTFRLVPTSAPPHRPAVPLQGPKVEGVEPAITTGAPGEEIHVNDLGEVKIRFPWDRSGIFDDKSSTWVRCIQMGMGGAMLLPRVGWEVPVMYVDGNPDRPVLLGRTYNGESVVPYGLPGGKATSTLQSATSPGGSGTNEIRMGDSAGGMEMFVHATKDQSVLVGGSATTKVGANETHDVGLSLGVKVTGAQSLTVGASQTVNVGTDAAIEVAGGRTETVGGLELNKITANRTVVAKGAYVEAVGALYGLLCNQANTDVKGGYLQSVCGALAQTTALGFSESVAGARGQTTGGVRNIVAGKAYGENVTGLKSVTAGASSVNAGGKVMTASSGGPLTVSAASAKITASGAVVVQAPNITIDVGGSLTAGALTLSGGTLKIGKGTSKLQGKIKRKGGSKIE